MIMLVPGPGRPQLPPGTSRGGAVHMARSPAHGPRSPSQPQAPAHPPQPQQQQVANARNRSYLPPPPQTSANAGQGQSFRPDHGAMLLPPSQQDLQQHHAMQGQPSAQGGLGIMHAPLTGGTMRSLPTAQIIQGLSTGEQAQGLRRPVEVQVEVVSAGASGTGPAYQAQAAMGMNPLGQTQRSGVIMSAAAQARQVYMPPQCPHRVPTTANVEHLDPISVYNMMRDSQCVLVDVRGEDRAAGIIEGAVHIPAIASTLFTQRIPELLQQWAGVPLIVFTCQYSAHRAPQCANWYRMRAPGTQRVGILSGGFRNWEALGLPVAAAAHGEQAAQADDLALRLGSQFAQQQQQHGGTTPTRQPPGQTAPASGGYLGAQQQAQVAVQPPPGTTKAYVPPHCPNRVPTAAGVETLEPVLVFNFMRENKCILVDLRAEDRAAGVIDGAIYEPAIDTVPFISKVPQLVQKWGHAGLVVFTCQYSAHRAPQCANWYRAKAHPRQRVAILTGGFRQWEAMGLPVLQCPPQLMGGASGDAGASADEDAMRIGTRFVKSVPAHFAQTSPHMVNGDGAHTAPYHSSTAVGAASPVRRAPAVPSSKSSTATPVTAPSSAAAAAAKKMPAAAQRPQKTGYVRPHLPNTVPTITNVEHIEPFDCYDMMADPRCLVVDLRGEDRAAGLIEGALHEPAIDRVPFPTKVPKLVQQWADKSIIIFTCQYSAHRAPQCANWYREKTHPRQRVGILSGGFRGWEGEGLPVLNAAKGADARAADKVAMKLGTQFIDGCITGVPGGGFHVPTEAQRKRAAAEQAAFVATKQPQPQVAQAPMQAAPAFSMPPVASGITHQQSGPGYTTVIHNVVPTSENVENIDPKTVYDLVRRRKCLLVDLRDEDRAAGLIEGATHESAFGDEPFPIKAARLAVKWEREQLVIFTCQYSAHRAPQCANWYREKAPQHQRVGILAGGFRGWEALGLPVQHLAKGEEAQKADEVAVCLGARFTANCLAASVPGGGFCMPPPM
eukprot:TRINITY_DN17607_c0_g1_i2.p1 TRINITY_DN17607_c0_g1~~TRINITY_DN17607_c0_g1_i2.p1  ORF type:complete len:1006 (+),score=217.19 TRINITY_DN17607_c0_g1_i2:93-3110(+)